MQYYCGVFSGSAFNEPQFVLGEPLHPFEQLIAILPPSSARLLLPKPLADAVDSPILAAVFPENSGTNFTVDPNGQEKEYMWLPLLPFIDTAIVRNVARGAAIVDALTEDERQRNAFDKAAVLLRVPDSDGDGDSDHREEADQITAVNSSWTQQWFPGALTGLRRIATPTMTSSDEATVICLLMGTLDINVKFLRGVDRYAFIEAPAVVDTKEPTEDNDSPSTGLFGDDEDPDEDLGAFSLLDDDSNDNFAADFQDTARMQKFAPLPTLDAKMRTYVGDQGLERAFVTSSNESAENK